MSKYVPFVPGITVSGNTVLVLIEFVESFSVLHQVMLECLGVERIDPAGWYSQEGVLRAYGKIEALLGGRGLERAGKLVPARAMLPPGIRDAHSVLERLDATYHMNHCRDGVPMFDPATGVQLDGIGHYRYAGGDREAMMECDNPYPCRFDSGLFHGFVARFETNPTVTHEPGSCRSHGDPICRYRARW